jgi:beta-galactosidase
VTNDRILPVSHLLYGGDYNPEQWLGYPGTFEEDLRLMKLASVNTVSLGIFSWVSLEPEEGSFTFEWMDRVMDGLAENNIGVNLATPSGAKPSWLAAKYPEVRRVTPEGLREPQYRRHNHCPTSPVYREKVRIINTKLVERYGNYPNLQLWHISNEYGGYCRCDLCLAAFRQWLRKRYNNDLEALNEAWWTRFWSHTYTDWEQIIWIDAEVHGLLLDWKRFMTDQCVDFMLHEMEPLRRLTPQIPITTNMMGTFEQLDYRKFAPHLDYISWDSYPSWHSNTPDTQIGMQTAFLHDLNRSMKGGKPFLLMETTPSMTNWQPVSRPRRPGVNRLNGLQAVAHGSDAVLYFQWRKGRGSSEKFHGAVVDHSGSEHTRVFRECAALGHELTTLGAVQGARTSAEVGLIYDWENRWAIEAAQGPRNREKNYQQTCEAHYRPFWERGIPVDIIPSDEEDLSRYKLLIAPMLYMLKPGVAERITAFVEAGGTFVATYLTGITNETDLCFIGGYPGPLRSLLGIWMEETDVLHDHQEQTVIASEGSVLSGEYAARQFCDIIHPEGETKVLATYGSDFYAGSPAVTVNRYGAGRAFYVASRNDDRFSDDLLGGLAQELALATALPGVTLPAGVSAQRRVSADGTATVFLMNFNPEEVSVDLGGTAFVNATSGDAVPGTVTLPGYGAVVLAVK